jgi:protein disulfide-isomerase A6
MFSSKGTTSPLYKSLAIEFQGRITMAQARDTQKQVVAEFNIDKFPTLVVLPGGNTPGVVYEGELTPQPLLQFLSTYAAMEPPPSEKRNVPAKEGLFVMKQLTLVDYTPKKITDVAELAELCFNRPGVCYLHLSQDETDQKIFAAVNKHINPKQKLRIYSTNLLDILLESDEVPTIIALNSAKRWYKAFQGDVKEKNIIEWIDSVKMGEGKKLSLNQALLDLVAEETPKPHDEL